MTTLPGILKGAAMLTNIIGFICVMVSELNYVSRANWFNFVAMGGFWITGILLVFYLFHIIEKFYMINWLKIEFGYCALWSFFYMTASIAVAAGGLEAWAAAAFFGFVAMAIYGFDAYLKFKGWRSGQIAQGERTVATASSTMSGETLEQEGSLTPKCDSDKSPTPRTTNWGRFLNSTKEATQSIETQDDSEPGNGEKVHVVI
ncbi:unnamed protein product [Darwinula stevensoni]|uniref:MARVEL domain-containing protein n=1 Tax=Darwinula stevensoni TaxID=69355 RepID=A0A7R9A4Z8_9CRUS|nr:unnamed protein product [Darwinula stevensoni]CAG0890980.1 unnamed protein product [Darwinula stevensoni]